MGGKEGRAEILAAAWVVGTIKMSTTKMGTMAAPGPRGEVAGPGERQVSSKEVEQQQRQEGRGCGDRGEEAAARAGRAAWG